MYTVVLVIHLMLAVAIIGLVLLQRSSGGGFVGGSGGMGDFATARGAANALTRLTTWCAILFFCTSIALAYIVKVNVAQSKTGILADAPAAQTQTVPAATPAADAAKTPEKPAPAAPAPSAPLNKD